MQRVTGAAAATGAARRVLQTNQCGGVAFHGQLPGEEALLAFQRGNAEKKLPK
jgi:hypothetical protein